MTKAKRIRQLATSKQKFSIREIADRVSAEIGECSVEYVSAVRQRMKAGSSKRPCDRKWAEKYKAANGVSYDTVASRRYRERQAKRFGDRTNASPDARSA